MIKLNFSYTLTHTDTHVEAENTTRQTHKARLHTTIFLSLPASLLSLSFSIQAADPAKALVLSVFLVFFISFY